MGCLGARVTLVSKSVTFEPESFTFDVTVVVPSCSSTDASGVLMTCRVPTAGDGTPTPGVGVRGDLDAAACIRPPCTGGDLTSPGVWLGLLRGSGTTRTGMLNENVEPWPGSEST